MGVLFVIIAQINSREKGNLKKREKSRLNPDRTGKGGDSFRQDPLFCGRMENRLDKIRRVCYNIPRWKERALSRYRDASKVGGIPQVQTARPRDRAFFMPGRSFPYNSIITSEDV